MVSETIADEIAVAGETCQCEPHTGYDGQGFPSYGSPYDFTARRFEYDTEAANNSGAQFVTQADGSQVLAPLTLYLRGDAEDVPNQQDRITVSGYTQKFIVAAKRTASGIGFPRTQADHHRLRCRLESAT